MIKELPGKYKSNESWAGWRWPDYSQDSTRHDLNFWNFTPETSMGRLTNKETRADFVREVAQEMDQQIKMFKELATKHKL